MTVRFGGLAVAWSVVMQGERHAQLAPARQLGCGTQPGPARRPFGLFPGIGEAAGLAGERWAGPTGVGKRSPGGEHRVLRGARRPQLSPAGLVTCLWREVHIPRSQRQERW